MSKKLKIHTMIRNSQGLDTGVVVGIYKGKLNTDAAPIISKVVDGVKVDAFSPSKEMLKGYADYYKGSKEVPQDEFYKELVKGFGISVKNEFEVQERIIVLLNLLDMVGDITLPSETLAALLYCASEELRNMAGAA